jgi:phosphate transport system permease protein
VSLAVIVVPVVVRTTEDMLTLVPDTLREAAASIGLPRSLMIRKVAYRAAQAGMVTGVLLAVARISGETAPLLFTALMGAYIPVAFNGSFPFVHFEMNQPFPSLTVQIFKYATRPEESVRDLAWGGILVLITLIFVLNLAIRYFTRTRQAR